MTADMVNHPQHYRGARFESIDVIEAYSLSFHLGNAFKYIVRHAKKGGRQDLQKALWYLKRFVDNGLAYNAQKRAWKADDEHGVKGVSPHEIARDFGLSEDLQYAAFCIISQSAYKGDTFVMEAIRRVEIELARP